MPGSAPDLQEKGRRQADAVAYFMTGLFAEENAGPEKALESKRKVLDLDPGCTDLAIDVSGEYLRRGDTPEAIAVLKNAISATPKVTAPYLALSMIYLRQLQKPDLAAKYAQQCLDVAPQSFSGYALLLEIYQSQGQLDKVARVLDRAARAKSDDPSFWISLAEISVREATSPSAPETRGKVNRFLDEAAQHADNNLEILSRIGDLYVKAGEFSQAISFYQNIQEAKPGFPQIRERLAACYIETDQVAPAIVQVEALVKANPLSLPAYEQLTQLYLKTGDLSKALANARQALIIEPTNIDRHMMVVKLLFSLKRMNDAANALADARQQFPQVVRLAHLYGVALNEAGRHEEAVRVFEQAVVEAPGTNQSAELDSQFFFDYAAAAEQAGQYVQAAELFRKCIALDPAHSAEACNYLGYMWVDRGENLDEAERMIRQALAADPTNGAYLDSLGWLLYKQGKYDDSVATLLSAGEHLSTPDPVVLEHIADAYHQLGKQAEAVLYWQKALQLDPTNKQLVAKLDQASSKVAQQPVKTADERK